MNIGLDIHGVINTDPEFFSILTKTLIKQRCEIHIITGEEITDKLCKELKDWGIEYTHLFSITSYHKSIGTIVGHKNNDPTQPIINDVLWDSTKSRYCERNDIDIHIDDSKQYGKWFDSTTKYIVYNKSIRKLLEVIVFCNLWRD